MSVIFARLRLVTALALVVAGVVVTGPAHAGTGTPGGGDGGDPDDYYLCHATGADGHWVTNDPADGGDANGHIGESHQGARDIVPPVTLADGTVVQQNWTPAGQAVWANGCSIPAQPAPDVVPRSEERKVCTVGVETRTWDEVTPYVWDTTLGWVLDPAATSVTNESGWVFTRPLTAAEKVALACARPEQPRPVVVHEEDDRSTCAAGVEHREWDEVTPFVWSDEVYDWVPGTTQVQDDTGWTFVRDLTNVEKAELDCARPVQPPALVVERTDDRSTCAAGVQHREWSEVTPYVFDVSTWSWVLGDMEVQDDTGWTFVRHLTAVEKAELDCPRPVQPQALVVNESDERASCETGVEARSWDEVTPYVWSDEDYDWVRGAMEVQNDTGWQFARPLTSAEKVELDCPRPQQPPALVVERTDDRSTCAAGVQHREWSEVTPYVFDVSTWSWVLGDMEVQEDTGWTFVRDLTAVEKAELDCPRPVQPNDLVVGASDERASCSTGVEARSWDEVTPFVFDPRVYDWVRGTTYVANDSDWQFARDLTPAEKAQLDCPAPPRPVDAVTAIEQERESCVFGGTETWTESTTVGWSFDEVTWAWVESAPVVTTTEPVLTPYSAAELAELCVDETEGEQETDEDEDRDGGEHETDDEDPAAAGPADLDVAGEQLTAAVPTVVNAGATQRPAGAPSGLTLWALTCGLLLIAYAGTRRRTPARR